MFTRDDVTGAWSAATLAQDQPAPDFLLQILSFGTRDRVTGIDLVFAAEMPRGIFAGSYDPIASGHIRWSAQPELDASTAFSGGAGRLRVSSFAEANGRTGAQQPRDDRVRHRQGRGVRRKDRGEIPGVIEYWPGCSARSICPPSLYWGSP